MSESSAKVREILIHLRRMTDILVREGESSWINGIRTVIQAGESIQNSDAALAEMSSIYRSMHGGAGSFSDYFIWRDDFNERKEANKEYEVLSTRLWELLM